MGLFGKKDIELIVDKKVHLLVLDQKWHELFKGKKPLRIQQLEKKLNDLLKEQGTLTTELKEYRKLKQKMMAEIVSGMGDAYDGQDKKALKTLERNKKYIEQINNKLEHHEKRLGKVPDLIQETNKELVNATMKQFYQTMLSRKQTAERLEEEVKRLQIEIKEAIENRDQAKAYHQELYGYIHDVVGPNIIEQYDRYYIGETDD